jgi:guanylate kinase
MNPFPLILSSPSGGGKTTISRLLLERRSDVGYSVSATTRTPRDGEVNGRDYFFLSTAEFDQRRQRGEFAECAQVHGNWYGTLRSQVEATLARGTHVIMDIDVQGAKQFQGGFPESVMIFLLPPSADVLLRRLADRRTESTEDFRKRVRAAREELRAAMSYQYAVVNDDLEHACRLVSSIIDAEAVRHARQPMLSGKVAELVDGLDRQLAHLTTPV